MQALVITLREGVEAALVVGIILVYLKRIGDSQLGRYVYAGLILAAAASVMGALLFTLIGFDPENEVLEGTVLAVAAVLVASLVIWMGRASRNIKGRIEDRLERITGDAGRRQGWALFGFSFFMVLREGIEIVVFLAALSLRATEGLLNLIGGLAGLGVALLFGVLFVKGSMRINFKRFFQVTGLVLVALVIRLLAGSMHEFSEVRLLPSRPWELAIIGFLVRDSTSMILLIALILVPGLAILPGVRLRPQETESKPGETPADRRRRLAVLMRSRRWAIAVVAIILVIAAPLAASAYMSEASAFRPAAVELRAQDGSIHVPLTELKENTLYKFLYRGGHKDTRFIAINRGWQGVGTAFDACSICPPVGFYQDGVNVICDNCNAPIEMTTIGMPGGCNPMPLASSVVGGELTVSVSDLDPAGESTR